MTKKPSRLDYKKNKKLISLLLYYPLIIGVYFCRFFSYFSQPYFENIILYIYKIFSNE